MTSTDIVIVDSQVSLSPTLPPTFRALFDTSSLSDGELIDFQITASEYTGGETLNAKRFYSKTVAQDGEKVDKIVWLWGLFAYPKTRTDQNTGEISNNVGIVFQLGDSDGPSGIYLSFESISATRFVERSLFPLIQRGIIGVGDWSVGLPVQIWEVQLTQGHTYRFKLRKPSEV